MNKKNKTKNKTKKNDKIQCMMCQELQKNLQVVHDQVTINHVLISAGKQKSKHKTSKSIWRTVTPQKGSAISLKHTWKRKFNTNAAIVGGFHWTPPE